MKMRVLRVIQVFFKSSALKFINALSKLSRIILKMNKSGNKQEDPLQEQTEEVSRRIGESRVDPQPPKPPTPVRAREIPESTDDSQSTQRPNSIGVRKIGVSKVTKQPPKPPRPVR
jgi:hypothetical protein